MLFDVLKKYDLETVEKSNKKLPIIIQSFEKDALVKFGTVSDLPLVQLMFWNNTYAGEYDLKDISTYAHGVGPAANYIFYYKGETFSTTSKSVFV